MKSILLTITALLCCAPFSHAEVFIYKNKLKTTATGGGESTKESITGWTIINETGDVSQVLVYPSRKFAVVPMKSIEFGTTLGPKGKTYMFFLQHDVWTGGDGSFHVDTGGAKGVNANMSVNGQTWSVPKTFNWSGRSTYQASGGGAMTFLETTGSFQFDKAWTNASNAQGDNVEAASTRLADALVQAGFVEF